MAFLSPNDEKTGESSPSTRMPTNAYTQLKEAGHYRAVLHHSSLALVEDSSVSAALPPPSGYETRHQVALPYFGIFGYSVAKKRWLFDPNRILFVSPGWEFFDDHPVSGLGHAALLINPSRSVLDEICGGLGPNRNSAFNSVSRASTMNLRLLIHQVLRMGPSFEGTLYKDEWVIHTLREAIETPPQTYRKSRRLIDRAKEVLHAYGCDRLSLKFIAKEVGVSPVYLTQEFSRSEGTPLYQYQLRLRLSRALLELPHCDDITGLALDLGFSSHSHFSSVFRKTFGLTPSVYRCSTFRQPNTRVAEYLTSRSPAGRAA